MRWYLMNKCTIKHYVLSPCSLPDHSVSTILCDLSVVCLGLGWHRAFLHHNNNVYYRTRTQYQEKRVTEQFYVDKKGCENVKLSGRFPRRTATGWSSRRWRSSWASRRRPRGGSPPSWSWAASTGWGRRSPMGLLDNSGNVQLEIHLLYWLCQEYQSGDQVKPQQLIQ